MHAPHSALSPPDNHSGGGGRKKGLGWRRRGDFLFPFATMLAAESFVFREDLVIPFPPPLSLLPPPPVFSEFGCRGSESRERLPLPPSGGHTTSPLSFLPPFSLLEFFPVRTNLRGRRGGGGKLRGLHLSQALLGVPQLCSRKGKYRTWSTF